MAVDERLGTTVNSVYTTVVELTDGHWGQIDGSNARPKCYVAVHA